VSTESIPVLMGRVGAHKLHSMYDSRELTKNARVAFEAKWYNQTDPALPEAERLKRAAHLRQEHFARMALASALSRSAKKSKG